jgi:enoyl-CoA hydratase/carnithine racemase
MSGSDVQIKMHDHAGTIIINRPERRNALSRQLVVRLQQALYDLHQELKVRAVILTGAGPSFCAGMDLHEIHETLRGESPERQWHQDALAYRDLIQSMLRFPKPIIAAVHGAVYGGGAGLVLASDLVVAAQTARFSIPAPRRGLVAGMVAPLLVFRIGGGQAARLMLTGEAIDAERGADLGIFHEVVAEHLVWARANELAQDFAGAAREALALTKRMLNETIGEHLTTMLAAGAAATAASKTTAAAAEGVAAFIEKRAPEWP